eukprot:9244391-Pyramimonas_sp.AAC.1
MRSHCRGASGGDHEERCGGEEAGGADGGAAWGPVRRHPRGQHHHLRALQREPQPLQGALAALASPLAFAWSRPTLPSTQNAMFDCARLAFCCSARRVLDTGSARLPDEV